MNEQLKSALNELRLISNDIILSGSLALVMLGKIKERECNDLDIIVPHYIDFSSLGTININRNPYLDKCATLTTKSEICVDIIIDSKRIFTTIGEIKVSNAEDIYIAKFKALVLSGSIKHKEDLLDLIKNV